jgi:uncharacterized protein (DUF305 family)
MSNPTVPLLHRLRHLLASGAFVPGLVASGSGAGILAAGAPLATAVGAQVPARPASAAPAHTAADVRFMQQMIQHHAQAVTMAAMVPARTARVDLRSLAERIDVTQEDEIRYMAEWLRERGAEVPDPAHAHHAAHDGMPGMLSAEALEALERSSGAEFERLFLSSMIRHHEGAIVMVVQLFGSPGAAQEPTIFQFATDVDADQRAEIARMRALLAALP